MTTKKETSYVEQNKARLSDELYEVVKDFDEFKDMGLDERGEFILYLLDELDKDIHEALQLFKAASWN